MLLTCGFARSMAEIGDLDEPMCARCVIGSPATILAPVGTVYVRGAAGVTFPGAEVWSRPGWHRRPIVLDLPGF